MSPSPSPSWSSSSCHEWRTAEGARTGYDDHDDDDEAARACRAVRAEGCGTAGRRGGAEWGRDEPGAGPPRHHPAGRHGATGDAARSAMEPEQSAAARYAFIRERLKKGPQTVGAIRQALAAQGYQFSARHVGTLLRRAGARVAGRSRGAVWSVPAHASTRRTKKLRTRHAPASDVQDRATDVQDRATIVARILQEANRPLPLDELSVLARQAGVPHLTGIYNYVRQGYISASGRTRKSRRYTFKMMPPPQSTPTTSRSTIQSE